MTLSCGRVTLKRSSTGAKWHDCIAYHNNTILSSCDFIDDIKIIEFNIEPPIQSIKVKARLKNGLMLQITESIGEEFRRYSYNLQDGDVTIRRWDNAPHWNEVRTYPFHVHIKDKEEPIESKEMFISDVIAELKKLGYGGE